MGSGYSMGLSVVHLGGRVRVEAEFELGGVEGVLLWF